MQLYAEIRVRVWTSECQYMQRAGILNVNVSQATCSEEVGIGLFCVGTVREQSWAVDVLVKVQAESRGWQWEYLFNEVWRGENAVGM